LERWLRVGVCLIASQDVAVTTTNKLPLSIFCIRNAKTISNSEGCRAKRGRRSLGQGAHKVMEKPSLT